MKHIPINTLRLKRIDIRLMYSTRRLGSQNAFYEHRMKVRVMKWESLGLFPDKVVK